MAPRADLLGEVDTTLDGSGNYTGPWIDTGGILKVRIAWQSNMAPTAGVVKVEESSDQANVIRVQFTGSGGDSGEGQRVDVDLGARYFRFKISGGTANATLRLSLRSIA